MELMEPREIQVMQEQMVQMVQQDLKETQVHRALLAVLLI